MENTCNCETKTRRNKITSIMLTVTHTCNLRCRYCFVHQEPKTMTYQVAKDTADFLINNCKETGDTPSINFFGGEPLVCWDSIIVPLTLYIREELKVPFSLSLTSNCTLMTQDKIDFMKKYNIGMLFSIDGKKETQDYNRPCADGSSSFDKLEPWIKIINENFHPTFRSTAIPPTCGHVFENIMFAKDMGFQSFFVIPNVFEEWTEGEWETLSKEMRKFSNYYIDEFRNGNMPISFSDFDKSLRSILRINQSIQERSFRVNCNACNKCGFGLGGYASIHPDGSIYACQEMTSDDGEINPFYIGNIYTGIDYDRRDALVNLFEPSKIKGADCDNCRYNRICDGGCVANNYLVNGNLNEMPKFYCKWMQLLLDEAIYVANNLGDCKMFVDYWWRINSGKGRFD